MRKQSEENPGCQGPAAVQSTRIDVPTKNAKITIPNGNGANVPFLYEMLFEAFRWDRGSNRLCMQIFFENVEFHGLLADFGKGCDVSVIAEVKSESIGAAWNRFWADDNHSYGFVARHIPELGMAVRRDFSFSRRRTSAASQTERDSQISGSKAIIFDRRPRQLRPSIV